MAIKARLKLKVSCDSCLSEIYGEFDESGDMGEVAYRARLFSRSKGWAVKHEDDGSVKDVCPRCFSAIPS